jgi:hypothetical protein
MRIYLFRFFIANEIFSRQFDLHNDTRQINAYAFIIIMIIILFDFVRPIFIIFISHQIA